VCADGTAWSWSRWRARERRPAAGAQESVGADLGEASWQNMLQKAAEEDLDRQRRAPRPMCWTWTTHGRAQIVGSRSCPTPALTSAARIFARTRADSRYPGRRNCGCVGVIHAVPSAVSPHAVTRTCACGWESSVRDQVWRTGQHAGRAADPRAVVGERLHGRGGFAKQGRIDQPLVRPRDARSGARRLPVECGRQKRAGRAWAASGPGPDAKRSEAAALQLRAP